MSSWLGVANPPALAGQLSAADQTYEREIHRLARPKSHIPSSDEQAALQLLMDPDMFTDDAWQAMVKLQRYAQYLETLADAGVEEAPGCESCAANRMMLERAWQTVANEFYDPAGRFSQQAWAGQLQAVLAQHGGALHSKAEAYSALRELLGSLGDKYSTFMEPAAFRRALRQPMPAAERDYLAAQFVGVGVQLGGVSPQGGRLVEAPLVESPAEAAGIRRGDRVLEIEGIPAESLTLDETTTLLRGPAGSSVGLTVAPCGPAQQSPRQLLLERRPLPQPAVKEAQLPLPDGRVVQYVRLHYFTHEATGALAQVVASAEAEGQHVAGYVLDLRNNPGGVFEEAVAIASLFQDPMSPVAETVRSGSSLVDVVWRPAGLSPASWPDVLAGPLTSKPLVLLVNSNSASASEVLAGGLRDYNRAVIVGERTFGKGLVQYYFPMGDGSGLKLTAAKYLTPKAYDITKFGGLTPDFACKDYPHGVFTPGRADRCVTSALGYIMAAPAPDPLSYSPLYASTGTEKP
ncbi:hypothetical protein OEZ85_008338 [Tetradesmus obliquus]|uniref:PDZ domain-containing protein n=1 Tax=Tetradesmus obliquus TaxID=3088 RepID=A0ABY8TIJ4_TETOB|nr:hypothetical protein OEZ85_008338 [Tetradesmus obliquus]